MLLRRRKMAMRQRGGQPQLRWCTGAKPAIIDDLTDGDNFPLFLIVARGCEYYLVTIAPVDLILESQYRGTCIGGVVEARPSVTWCWPNQAEQPLNADCRGAVTGTKFCWLEQFMSAELKGEASPELVSKAAGDKSAFTEDVDEHAMQREIGGSTIPNLQRALDVQAYQ